MNLCGMSNEEPDVSDSSPNERPRIRMVTLEKSGELDSKDSGKKKKS